MLNCLYPSNRSSNLSDSAWIIWRPSRRNKGTFPDKLVFKGLKFVSPFINCHGPDFVDFKNCHLFLSLLMNPCHRMPIIITLMLMLPDTIDLSADFFRTLYIDKFSFFRVFGRLNLGFFFSFFKLC